MVWKVVASVPIWEINEFGTIRIIQNGLTKTFRNKHQKGYLLVEHCNGGQPKKYLVHKLVAEAFLNSYKKGMQLNHKDGNKFNNHISNLEWVTLQQNILHQFRTLSMEGSGIIVSLKEAKQIYASKDKYFRKKDGSKSIALKFTCSRQTVHKIWRAGSYLGHKLND